MVTDGVVQAVLRLLDAARPRCGPVTVVAVDGPSGSGKTTLANAVAGALRGAGGSVEVVHVDDLVPGWDGLAETPALLLEQVLEPISRGERAAFRAWDWVADTWGEERVVPPADVLVVEGCSAFAHPADDRVSVRVWVDAPTAQRHSRAIARDGVVYEANWERWAAQERALFARDGTASRADLVVRT